ncbi:Rieske (2Fe-2S) protein [Pseudomonas syringae pv. tomato]|uniref:Rieske (2Fe-2S) protein n=1 Tax=Pseudomonas syringae pv. tomato TaxID=323 RepID=A0AB36KWR7_PSEUB|nr:aromatic ring-hydroxylating dioxygenase subunit alpha [Pseudomonas syringae group genomosp. 3]MBI6847720.1 aromatic ring-hydroxylating dioxygenase subunit alpha [Pseudomonas syringae]MBX6506793.1 aromatic ring-hydroxylating dioxygenase subunit alpha [Pseudomonas syringae pv. tomato]OPE59535.1 Rieske (2Fe-2S) protein [Pseudomonas syringae pv. tomato]TES53526.1 aromatic ring-hydroxylating dioxygenase subunit alpha [Pseudomonas syringae pv. tomato]TES76559.1 aromatic ring-hydroxylating dioxyge
MNTRSDVSKLIAQRKPRHALPRALYSNLAVYQQDLQQLWHKDWIFAGHTFELEKSGQYLSLQIGDYPVAVVRGADGQVRAFHNSCRHRGSKVCPEAKGKVAKLVCPYHKWTFELDGRLLFAGNMGDDFDKSQYNLKPVHCEIVNTYIYVCVAEAAPDFSAFREAVTPFLMPHNLEDCKVAFESNLIEKGNWKLVFENNRECYHCDGTHPELMNSFVENLSVAGVGGSDDPQLTAHWDRCEAAGLPSRLVMDNAGRFRITRIPLSSGAVSYTMDGKPAVAVRLDASGEADIGALLYFNYPSTWNHFLGDHALSFRVLPLGPNETLVTTKWIVKKTAVDGLDYDLDRLTKVWLATNDQDRTLVEGAQVGVNSPAYEPGPFSSKAENGVCQFDDWYCEIMLDRLGDDSAQASIKLKSVG